MILCTSTTVVVIIGTIHKILLRKYHSSVKLYFILSFQSAFKNFNKYLWLILFEFLLRNCINLTSSCESPRKLIESSIFFLMNYQFYVCIITNMNHNVPGPWQAKQLPKRSNWLEDPYPVYLLFVSCTVHYCHRCCQAMRGLRVYCRIWFKKINIRFDSSFIKTYFETSKPPLISNSSVSFRCAYPYSLQLNVDSPFSYFSFCSAHILHLFM